MFILISVSKMCKPNYINQHLTLHLLLIASSFCLTTLTGLTVREISIEISEFTSLCIFMKTRFCESYCPRYVWSVTEESTVVADDARKHDPLYLVYNIFLWTSFVSYVIVYIFQEKKRAQC